MSNDTEIVRSIEVEGKTIILHIHLSEDEVRRLLLPHIASAFASELRRYGGFHVTSSGNTLSPMEATS